MTVEKIKKIEFNTNERTVKVTFTDNFTLTFYHKDGETKSDCKDDEREHRIINLASACIGFLTGDKPESMSYRELSNAERCYLEDLAITNKTEEGLIDFESHLAEFENWESDTENYQPTNLDMFLFGMEHIAKNHGFDFSKDLYDGVVSIDGGCNVPTLSDVEMLCEDCKIPRTDIESCDLGIDVYLPGAPWSLTLYEKPAHEFWRRVE